jgi:hypothetical protein
MKLQSRAIQAVGIFYTLWIIRPALWLTPMRGHGIFVCRKRCQVKSKCLICNK